MKTCIDCGTQKDITEYFTRHDVPQQPCKACSKIRYKGRHKNQGPQKPSKFIKVDQKECSICKLTLPASAFSKRALAADRLNSKCKKCANLEQNAKRSTIIGKHYSSMATMKSSFNITEDQLQNMLLGQQGCCKICSVDFGGLESLNGRTYCIDHNHNTNEIRGLLCPKCNRQIGLVENNPTLVNGLSFMYKNYLGI